MSPTVQGTTPLLYASTGYREQKLQMNSLSLLLLITFWIGQNALLPATTPFLFAVITALSSHVIITIYSYLMLYNQ